MIRERVEKFVHTTRVLLEQLTSLLETKQQSLKKAYDQSSLPDLDMIARQDLDANELVESINDLVRGHNEYHNNFVQIKADANNAIRLHYLAASRIQYENLVEADTNAESEVKKAEEDGRKLRERVDQLKSSLHDHGIAAKQISNLVNSFLSHKEICIEAVDSGYELRRRDGSIIKSLSEGEKRAITFCYFLATLQENGKTPKDFIVVVDDPISSLDTKALNYTSSLIRRFLGNAGQLIILTHNLHFMHEIRKWIAPKGKVQRAKENGEPIPLYFIRSVQRAPEEDRSSSIVALPTLLREHESEYHYLFSAILACAESGDASTEFLYLMPNAMRKVLEIFLSFKVPGGGGLTNQLQSNVIRNRLLAAGGDLARFHSIERLAETESHGDSLDPLVELPLLTIEETHQASKALIELITLVDSDHAQQMSKVCRRYPA